MIETTKKKQRVSSLGTQTVHGVEWRDGQHVGLVDVEGHRYTVIWKNDGVWYPINKRAFSELLNPPRSNGRG